MAKKILIIGGTGFVGGNIAKLAKKKWQVHIFAKRFRPGFKSLAFSSVDITNRERLLQTGMTSN